MCASSCQKGDVYEKFISQKYHRDHLPLLISPQILRQNDCGQVDCAIVLKSREAFVVEILEAKLGKRISSRQMARLERSAILIGAILDLSVQVKIV